MGFVASCFERLSAESRRRKLTLLNCCFRLDAASKIIDVGGELSNCSEQLIERHPWPHQITVLNIMHEHLERINARCPEVHTMLGDARNLPFANKSFDLVYSNAVIEHVGGWSEQVQMAKEVMRVGKAWFVTTPNRWFSFEFHTRLPLIGWLPSPWMVAVSKLWSYNHVAHKYQTGLGTHTRLLDVWAMHRLFPSSRIVSLRVTIWPETLIAVGADEALV